MKCRLLPLYIPPRGMSQLPCKLERGGLSLFSAKQKQQANRSRTASNHWLVWLSSQGGAAAASQGWSASRIRRRALYRFLFFPAISILYYCGHVSVPMCRPSGCCQADHGKCRKLAWLCAFTYVSLFPKEEKERKQKERSETRESGAGLQQRNGVNSLTCIKHVRRGNYKHSKIHRLPTS